MAVSKKEISMSTIFILIILFMLLLSVYQWYQTDRASLERAASFVVYEIKNNTIYISLLMIMFLVNLYYYVNKVVNYLGLKNMGQKHGIREKAKGDRM